MRGCAEGLTLVAAALVLAGCQTSATKKPMLVRSWR
jgi:hypothetical protein